MIIREAFEVLKAAGCISNQRSFSREWLGRGASYFSSTLARATTRTPSITVLLTLYSRIRNHVEDGGIADLSHQQVLDRLAGQLWACIMDRVDQRT